MDMTQDTILKIKAIVEELDLDWEYAYVGVRVQEPEFVLGPVNHRSHVWVDGEETAAELPGLCACKLDRLGINDYFGDHIAIVCGNEAEYGEDDGEIIIRDAEVVAIIC